MAATQAEIASAFKLNQFRIEGDDVTDRCVDLTAQYGITAVELSDAYDVFAFNRNAGSSVTGELVKHFQEHLRKNPPERAAAPTPSRVLTKGFAAKTPPSGKGAGLHAVLADHSNLSRDSPAARTPTPARKGSAPDAPATGSAAKRPCPSSAFKDRTQRGQVLATLNDHVRPENDAVPMEADGAAVGGNGRCAFELLGPQLQAGQRYMVDRLEDKVAYLDGRITAFAQALESAGLGVAQPLSAATQACFFACFGEGRLNEASAQLEGGLSCGGARVRLDLSRLPSLRIFTGQTIGVTGVNPTGRCLVAAQLHTGVPLPLPATPPEQLARLARRTGGKPLSVAVAAGPYTTTADLAFEPLEALLEALGGLPGGPPGAVVLAGPFLDAGHEAVAREDRPLQDVFEQEVLQRVGTFAREHPATRILLAPSARDVTAAPVFPTPPLPRPAAGRKGGAQPACEPLPENVAMLPNPATFALGEVVFGLATADAFKAMATNEVSRSAAGAPAADRMGAIAAQVLSQRSYFPVFPPPRGSMLDTAIAAAALPLPVTPDVLLLPSDLAAFAKLLPASGDAKVVCVNPGRLALGKTGGSWAHLSLRVAEEAAAALAGEEAATNAPAAHRVDSRCRVEITRV